jgi:gamma-glutamylcyclotransferase (GGCT)/AIG2-like uncharacterized protein YtfP
VTAKVFVYGTLRRGQKWHHLVERLVKAAFPATAPGRLYHLADKGYPAVLAGEGTVAGEVLEFDEIEEALRILDELEDYYGPGHPQNEYDRVVVAAMDNEGTEHPVYMYVCTEHKENWLSQSGVHIPSGDWLRREGR